MCSIAGGSAPASASWSTAAPSGIGTTAIQLAHACGATVFATAGSAEKCAACERLGAARAFDYRSEDFVAAVSEATGGEGVDVVLDIIGGDYLAAQSRVPAPERPPRADWPDGGAASDDRSRPILQHRLTITGSTLRPRTPPRKGRSPRALEREVWPLLDRGDGQADRPRRVPVRARRRRDTANWRPGGDWEGPAASVAAREERRPAEHPQLNTEARCSAAGKPSVPGCGACKMARNGRADQDGILQFDTASIPPDERLAMRLPSIATLILCVSLAPAGASAQPSVGRYGRLYGTRVVVHLSQHHLPAQWRRDDEHRHGRQLQPPWLRDRGSRRLPSAGSGRSAGRQPRVAVTRGG